MTNKLIEIAERASELEEVYRYPDYSEFEKAYSPLIDVYLRFNNGSARFSVEGVSYYNGNVIIDISEYTAVRIPEEVITSASPTDTFAYSIAISKYHENLRKLECLDIQMNRLLKEKEEILRKNEKINSIKELINDKGWDAVDKKYPLA